MRRTALCLVLMAVLAFGLGARVELWFQGWAGNRIESTSALQLALGDGRKLFAKHFFAKADAYFHNGYYPTIYDNVDHFQEGHLAGEEHHEEEHGKGNEDEDGDENFLGKPKDWIDRFGRHFYPSRHTHLGDSICHASCCQKPHDDPAGPAQGGDEREILPWLKLSAELDPQRIETYVVASYWLRGRLGRADEAERFLREGLQANPGDCEILFELGRVYYENRHDPGRARNVWELALKNWRTHAASQPDPDKALYAGLLNNLAMLEREQHNYPRAIQYYTALLDVSPNPASIHGWIDYLQTNGAPIKVGVLSPQ